MLVLAAREGNVGLSSHLISIGADINKGNKDNWTPLISASDNGHSAVVQLLVDAGAELDILGAGAGRSAIYSASRSGQLESGTPPILRTDRNFEF